MSEIENLYHDFIKERLRDVNVQDELLISKISMTMSDLHPTPKQTCSCGKPVVFVMHSRTFECTRCFKKWQLVMEVKPVP